MTLPLEKLNNTKSKQDVLTNFISMLPSAPKQTAPPPSTNPSERPLLPRPRPTQTHHPQSLQPSSPPSLKLSCRFFIREIKQHRYIARLCRPSPPRHADGVPSRSASPLHCARKHAETRLTRINPRLRIPPSRPQPSGILWVDGKKQAEAGR
jgi:hypothetical protein